MMTVEQKPMTADELMDLPDDGCRYELVRGELRTMSPGGLGHGWRSFKFATSLNSVVEARGLGIVVAGEVGFRLTTDPDTVRSPDAAFIRTERLEGVDLERGFYPGAPDLAVEVISPNDRYSDVDEKVGEWLEHGTHIVFVVNPRRRTVAVHRPGRDVRILGIDDTLVGEDVVPGWTLAVRDLFEQSSLGH
jgi:Uma2 family endonuclease